MCLELAYAASTLPQSASLGRVRRVLCSAHARDRHEFSAPAAWFFPGEPSRRGVCHARSTTGSARAETRRGARHAASLPPVRASAVAPDRSLRRRHGSAGCQCPSTPAQRRRPMPSVGWRERLVAGLAPRRPPDVQPAAAAGGSVALFKLSHLTVPSLTFIT